MNCNNCHTRLTGNEKYCPNCGQIIPRQEIVTNNQNNGTYTASIVLGIISLVGVTLIIFSPISFILSIIGLVLGINANKQIKKSVGIIINAVALSLSLLFIMFMIVFGVLINTISKGATDSFENFWHILDYEN